METDSKMESNNNSIETSLRHLKDLNFGKIPKTQNERVVALAAPHVESFDFFLGDGLDAVVANLPPLHFQLASGARVSIFITDAKMGKPHLTNPEENVDPRVFPRECVERGATYTAPATATFDWSLDGVDMVPVRQSLGDFPIMVKSANCHLRDMTPQQLVDRGELVNETGGYFVINGASRVLRLLSANRRNYPIAMTRKSWHNRDKYYTDKGVFMRCVKEDESSSVNILHYLNTGEAKLEFTLRRELFFVPLVMALKILSDRSDHQIYTDLIRGREKDQYFIEKVKVMLRGLQAEGLYTGHLCRAFLGRTFRHKLAHLLPPWYTDDMVARYLFQEHVLIHLAKRDKYDTLCMMARKLYSYVAGECMTESVDAVSMQEVALGGHTFLQLLKERLGDALMNVKTFMTIKSNKDKTWSPTDDDMRRILSRLRGTGKTFQTFIATGTLQSKTGCGLMQTTGLTVIMEHLNRMRDLSHLRAVHRGAYFVEMKTVEPRRLTGEAWGFICPVHTPDGAPCGLLNHLAEECVVVASSPPASSLAQDLITVLGGLGMTPVASPPLRPHGECLEVVVEGGHVGYVVEEEAKEVAEKLRTLKALGMIYKYTEIVYIPRRVHGGQYPGLFVQLGKTRKMRPVINLNTCTIEYVGTLEQLYLNVAVTPEEIEEGVHSHLETSKTAILSNVGKFVPFSDCNPNPRNMYQCQMAKQTMGTPFHNWQSQTANKIYRLQYPQVALVRNKHYDHVNMEEFCLGFNAVVAIISYTGYDMEDAMIINKCSMERGLAHGQIYKTEFVDLSELNGKKGKGRSAEVSHMFRRNPEDANQKKFLDRTGLPPPGTRLSEGDPYFCTYDLAQRTYRLTTYKGEDCVVDKYSIMSNKPDECVQRVAITIRIRRNPIIGDKFASRFGQKGILSRLYPVVDLPFSERGIMPDIIFNPHGIPSRMTAGKLIELLAGKSAAEFGKSFDTSPFNFSDENSAVDYFGQILEKAGFNYYGEDVLYSGTDGRPLDVQIYQGVIYYQRLRHMTADKWQVRATGTVDMVTRQPVKGRKRGGAIRFGEMERDCLISHGAVYTLKDRLMDCSDASREWVCESCGGLLSPTLRLSGGSKFYGKRLMECAQCGPDATLREIHLPFAFKYLVAELASVGVNTKLGVKGCESIMAMG